MSLKSPLFAETPPIEQNHSTMVSYTYRQLGYRPRESLAIHEKTVDDSDLRPTEILVKVAAAALNPVDIVLYNSRKLLFFSSQIRGFGRDFAGVVIATGDHSGYAIGDKVSGIYSPIFGQQGSFSEYLVVDTETNVDIGKIPKNLSLVQSAAFPLVFGTAFTLLTHFKKPADCERVLVIGGATAVGSFTIQLLKRVHKVPTVVSVNSSRSADRVKSFGADVIIDYQKEDVTNRVAELAQELGQFDLILDCVGSSDVFPVIHKVLKPKSENSGYASIAGDHVADYSATALGFFSLSQIKRLIYNPSYNYKPSSIGSGTWYSYARELFEAGTLDIGIDTVVEGLDNYAVAIEKLIDHKAQGKIVVKISDEE